MYVSETLEVSAFQSDEGCASDYSLCASIIFLLEQVAASCVSRTCQTSPSLKNLDQCDSPSSATAFPVSSKRPMN